jgi:ferredoxin
MRIEGENEINMTEASVKEARPLHALGQAWPLPGGHVLEATRKLGVYVESVCGGRATCGRCQVVVQEGNFAKHKIVSSNDHHLAEKGPKEERYERVRGLPDGRRLSCSVHSLRAISSLTCRRTRSSMRRLCARQRWIA